MYLLKGVVAGLRGAQGPPSIGLSKVPLIHAMTYYTIYRIQKLSLHFYYAPNPKKFNPESATDGGRGNFNCSELHHPALRIMSTVLNFHKSQ